MADTREANKLIRLCRQHAHVPTRVSPIPLDDLTFVGYGDHGWVVRRDADQRILDGFEATTMVDVSCAGPLLVRLRLMWKRLTCWNSPKCFTSLFLDPWKSLSDVECIFEKEHESPVITDAKSLYDAKERSESSTRNLAERRTAMEVPAIRQRLGHGFIFTGWANSDRQVADGLPECKKDQDGRTVRRQTIS